MLIHHGDTEDTENRNRALVMDGLPQANSDTDSQSLAFSFFPLFLSVHSVPPW